MFNSLGKRLFQHFISNLPQENPTHRPVKCHFYSYTWLHKQITTCWQLWTLDQQFLPPHSTFPKLGQACTCPSLHRISPWHPGPGCSLVNVFGCCFISNIETDFWCSPLTMHQRNEWGFKLCAFFFFFYVQTVGAALNGVGPVTCKSYVLHANKAILCC